MPLCYLKTEFSDSFLQTGELHGWDYSLQILSKYNHECETFPGDALRQTTDGDIEVSVKGVWQPLSRLTLNDTHRKNGRWINTCYQAAFEEARELCQ